MPQPENQEKKVSKTEIIKEELLKDVRQSLALERTVLANERTLMAYFRTALAIAAAGLTIQHFSNSEVLTWIGYALIPAGVAMGIVGWVSYANRKKHLNQDKQLLGLRLFKSKM